MPCPKCHGLMVEDCYKRWHGMTCLNCGIAMDRLIEWNKTAQQRTQETARHAAEAVFQKPV